MAEFVAKLGLDSSAFVSGLENAAKATGSLSSGLEKVSTDAQKLGGGFKGAGGDIDNLKTKVIGLGSSLNDIGSIGKNAFAFLGAGAVTAAISGLGNAFTFVSEKAHEADQAADTLNISLVKAGLSAGEAAKEQERLGQSAKKTADDFALPTIEVAKLQAKIAGFGGITGQQLDKLTEFSIGAANALDMPAEAVAKLIAKGADEEQQGKLSKLGIVFDKNASAAERMAIVQAKLGPVVEATKASTQDSIGAFDRIKNTIQELSVTIGSKLFDVFAPVFDIIGKNLTAFVPPLIDAFSAVTNTLSEAGAIIGEAFGAFKGAGGDIDITTGAINVLKGIMEGVSVAIRIVATAIAQVVGFFATLYNITLNVVNSFGGFKAIVDTLTPIVLTLTAAFVGYQIAVNAGAAATFVIETATGAYAALQAALSGGLGLATAAQTALNLAMSLNPVGAVVAGIAALAAGLYFAYQKSETFRNIIASLWEWVKKAVQAFIDLQMKFNPIIALFKLAYDNITPFRQAVDYLIGQLLKAWDAVKGFASAIGDLFGSSGDVKVKIGTEVEEVSPEEVLKRQLETKEKIDTLNQKDAPTIKTKIAKPETKDITDQIRAQQSEIDSAKREAEEASIADENARAIRNLENQFADKISAIREGNKKIQEDNKISNAQKEQFAALSNERILALEAQLQSQIAALKEKQRQKEAADEAKRLADLQKLRDEAEDEAEQARQDLAEMRRKRLEKEAQDAETNRRNIIKAFTDAIDEIRQKSADKAVDSAKNTEALDTEEAALVKSLRNREISYEEYSQRIADIDARRAELQAQTQEVSASSFTQSINGALNGLNTVITQKLAEFKAGFDKQFADAAQAGTLNLEALGQGAATVLGGIIAQGGNALDALKQTVTQTVGQLLEVYVAPIIASTLSFLGPFALPVAIAAITGLKGILASAIAGFREGGYTGNGGEGDIAGVVHGREFVHTAEVTRKYRPMFEHLHRGGELSTWMVNMTGNLEPAKHVNVISTYGIESRLDRLETAIVKSSKRFDSMRAVQMTVEHDPTLTIKAQSRNLQIRSARV